MDGPEGIYLVSGATLDGESVGPLFLTATEAHDVARKAITGIGGTVRILRDGDAGWVEVARYTDTGRYGGSRGWGIDWAVLGPEVDEEPFPAVVSIWAAVRSGAARRRRTGGTRAGEAWHRHRRGRLRTGRARRGRGDGIGGWASRAPRNEG